MDEHDHKSIAKVEPDGKSEVRQMIMTIAELAKDPAVDANKMTALADLQMKLMEQQRQAEFNSDKNKALWEMPTIAKSGAIKNKSGGVQSRYSRFEDIHRLVVPILRRHNLAISFNIGNSGTMITVQPILSHANGHVEKGSEMALAIDTSGSKNGTQGAGSAATYGKRHTIKAMLNIAEDGEDTDGRNTQHIEWEVWHGPTLEEAREKAKIGQDAYKSFFMGLSPMKRRFLVETGEHERLKK